MLLKLNIGDADFGARLTYCLAMQDPCAQCAVCLTPRHRAVPELRAAIAGFY